MKDKAKKKVLSISRKLLLANNVGDVLRDVQHLYIPGLHFAKKNLQKSMVCILILNENNFFL